jgi:pimeloyl-ACP methyl ester carboxylesterase
MTRGLFLCVLALMPILAGCMSFHKGALPDEPKTATFAAVDGARIHYVDVGQGPAVVLIHGFAASLETWAGIIPQLSKNHRVLALDLKGFGWTDRPEGDYSPPTQARIVLGLMSQRGIDKASVVGHSWGASVALAMTLMAPERVTKLALYDAWVYEDQLPTTFHWARASGLGETIFGLYYTERAEDKIALAFFDKSYVTQDLVDSVESALDRPGTTAAALAAVRGQRYAEVEKRYRTIQQQTLLLWGREDTVTPLKYGERLSNELPHARLVVYPRCGHFPMIEAKTPSDAELVSYLAEPVPAPVPVPAPAPPAAPTP